MTHISFNVTGTSQKVLAISQHRQWLLLQNDSNVDMYVAFKQAAVVHEGILLNAHGGSLVLDYRISPEDIYAIHGSTGNKVLLISYF